MSGCGPLQGAGPGAEGSLSAAAALFSQSENIPEVARLGAAGVDADVAGTAPPAARRRHLPSRASLRSPPAPPLRTRIPAPLPPSPGRAALGLCLYLTKTSCCAAIGTCIGET